MHHKVTEFEIFDDYTLLVLFDDHKRQVIDFEPVLFGEMWGPLRGLALFNQVSIDPIAHKLTERTEAVPVAHLGQADMLVPA